MTGEMQTWLQEVPLLAAGYHLQMMTALEDIWAQGGLYPSRERVFFAMQRVPFDQVQVAVLGQDPYHGPGQADGLAFSVPEGVPSPPSLRNIFREIASDVYEGTPPPFSTDLKRWADQGVLLLNTTLTVLAGKPGSHRAIGWEALTDDIVRALSNKRTGLVFMLWGTHAQSKRRLLDPHRHLILEAPHPSPLAAYRGFFGCRHFTRANAYLRSKGASGILW